MPYEILLPELIIGLKYVSKYILFFIYSKLKFYFDLIYSQLYSF